MEAEEVTTDGPVRQINTGGIMSLVSPPASAVDINLPFAMVSGKMLYQYPYPPLRRESEPAVSGPTFQANVEEVTHAMVPTSVQEQMQQQNSVFQAMQVDETLAGHLAGWEDDYSQPFWFGPQVEPNEPLPLANTRVQSGGPLHTERCADRSAISSQQIMIPPFGQMESFVDGRAGGVPEWPGPRLRLYRRGREL